MDIDQREKDWHKGGNKYSRRANRKNRWKRLVEQELQRRTLARTATGRIPHAPEEAFDYDGEELVLSTRVWKRPNVKARAIKPKRSLGSARLCQRVDYMINVVGTNDAAIERALGLKAGTVERILAGKKFSDDFITLKKMAWIMGYEMNIGFKRKSSVYKELLMTHADTTSGYVHRMKKHIGEFDKASMWKAIEYIEKDLKDG